MDAEIAQLVEQAGPYVGAALAAYGVNVLGRAENAAADATANAGRGLLRAVWHRRGERGREELEAAVRDAAGQPEDTDAAGALRQQIKRALREDPELLRELAAMLPRGDGPVTVTAKGKRSIAAQTITTAVTGDGARIRP